MFPNCEKESDDRLLRVPDRSVVNLFCIRGVDMENLIICKDLIMKALVSHEAIPILGHAIFSNNS